MLTLTEEQRFNAMVQIASGIVARQAYPHSEVAGQSEAYLKAILDRTNNPKVEIGSFQPPQS
jgi:hypothetical protein